MLVGFEEYIAAAEQSIRFHLDFGHGARAKYTFPLSQKITSQMTQASWRRHDCHLEP